jgi:hypothetical protein
MVRPKRLSTSAAAVSAAVSATRCRRLRPLPRRKHRRVARRTPRGVGCAPYGGVPYGAWPVGILWCVWCVVGCVVGCVACVLSYGVRCAMHAASWRAFGCGECHAARSTAYDRDASVRATVTACAKASAQCGRVCAGQVVGFGREGVVSRPSTSRTLTLISMRSACRIPASSFGIANCVSADADDIGTALTIVLSPIVPVHARGYAQPLRPGSPCRPCRRELGGRGVVAARA